MHYFKCDSTLIKLKCLALYLIMLQLKQIFYFEGNYATIKVKAWI